MLTLTTAIEKKDNLQQFEDALKSASFADDIIIYAMDMQDNQSLKKVAKKYQAKLVHIPRPKVIEEIRERQVKEAKGDWVLILDFDERISPELKNEITKRVKNDERIGAYVFRRRNYSLGYRLRYGGWGDDYQIRLIKKESLENWPRNIHAMPRIKGKQVKVRGYLEHHKDASLESMIAKTNRYSEEEARLFQEGNLPKVTQRTLFRKLIMETIRRGILEAGLLDGRIGLIQSMYQGFSVFISYAKLYERQTD